MLLQFLGSLLMGLGVVIFVYSFDLKAKSMALADKYTLLLWGISALLVYAGYRLLSLPLALGLMEKLVGLLSLIFGAFLSFRFPGMKKYITSSFIGFIHFSVFLGFSLMVFGFRLLLG